MATFQEMGRTVTSTSVVIVQKLTSPDDGYYWQHMEWQPSGGSLQGYCRQNYYQQGQEVVVSFTSLPSGSLSSLAAHLPQTGW